MRKQTTSRAATTAVRPAEAVLVLMVLMLLVLAVIISAPHPAEKMTTTQITVHAGDTLWSLVEAHPVPGMTTGEAASLVARMNGLGDEALHPGDTIVVPVGAPGEAAYAMR